MKIAVIKDAGISQGTQVLGGVYGQAEAQPDGTTKFKVAPEFKRISSLFDQMVDGQAPVQVGDYAEFEVSDTQAAAVKSNLMHAIGMRWDNLYGMTGLAARGNSMVASMLEMERSRALNGARDYIQSQGMHAFLVNYEIESETQDRSSDLGTMNQVLRSMKPIEGAQPRFTSVEQLPSDVISAKQAADLGNREGEFETVEQVRPWSFEGRKAAGLVTASVTVMAPNAEAAKSMAALVLGVEPVQQEANTQAALPAPREVAQTMTEAILQAPVAGLARFFGRQRPVAAPQPEAPAEVTDVPRTEVAVVNDITRSVNSFRENPIFQALTTKPTAVQNLRAGSEIVYQNYERDNDDEDENYRERPRY